MFTNKQISRPLAPEYNWTEYGEYYGCDYIDYSYLKPRKVPVVIEELECDPTNLASFAKVLVANTKPTKVEVSSKKWEVEIYYG